MVSKALIACAIATLCMACPQLAHADSTDDVNSRVETAQSKLSETQAKVQETTDAYNDAVAKADDLKAEQEKTQKRIKEIKAELPAQQARSSQSAKTLYIFQRDSLGLVQAIVSSGDLDEFLTTCQYIDCVNSHNITEMAKTQSLLDELDEQQAQLEQDQAEAQKAVEEANKALSDAQSAREAAQQEAIAAAEAQLANAEALAAEASSNEGVDSANGATEDPGDSGDESPSGTVSAGDVSWSSDKESFVNEWASRIDAYLAGSPMAGQGETYASAAWDYGVDPRWSPAISTVESTKGAYCFMPCNAWGWGSYSFGSWEEAITGHVAYLASMYGSSITYEAACIYCPPNASFWYNRCLEEMSYI